MKTSFVFAFFSVFLTVSEAFALPRCNAEEVGASFLGSWRKPGGEWELGFTCAGGEKAKIGIEMIEDIQSDDGIFFVMKNDGSREGEDFYNNACEAIADYCSTSGAEEENPLREAAGEDENIPEEIPLPAIEDLDF